MTDENLSELQRQAAARPTKAAPVRSDMSIGKGLFWGLTMIGVGIAAHAFIHRHEMRVFQNRIGDTYTSYKVIVLDRMTGKVENW